MGYSAEIDNALAAHGQWKQRLAAAIQNGSSEFVPAQVQLDNGCAFGKWFYSLPDPVKNSPQGQEVQKLHAAFHKEAARILDLAIKGQKEAASQAIAPGSVYINISGQLMMAMMRWKVSISG
jgi:hypothetical protein